MRKFNFAFVLFICLAVGEVRGQQPYLGTKTPYAAPHIVYTPPPAGYRPVFVNYVGRHGARFLTKGGTDTHVQEILEEAGRRHLLTDTGQLIRAMVGRLAVIEKGRYENISLLGAEEQRAIGERVLYNYKDAFVGKGLEVQVTYKVRTQQSADAFLHSYAGYAGERKIVKAADSLDTILRFYDLSPGYQRYKKSAGMRKAMDSLDRDGRTKGAAMEVWSRIFRPTYRMGGKESGADVNGSADASVSTDAIAFTDELYDLFCLQFSLSGEMVEHGYTRDSIDLGIVFSQSVLAWEDFRSEAQDFLEKGPGRDQLGIQVKVAVPLLADFVRAMDRATGHGDAGGPDAVFRFTHAEAISPFATLLGIPEASRASGSVYGYADHWRAADIIPLSANVQWILYSDGPHYLVKVLLNEREVKPGVGTEKGPYYRWEELRAYCLERLQKVNAELDEDMLGYLKGLR